MEFPNSRGYKILRPSNEAIQVSHFPLQEDRHKVPGAARRAATKESALLSAAPGGFRFAETSFTTFFRVIRSVAEEANDFYKDGITREITYIIPVFLRASVTSVVEILIGCPPTQATTFGKGLVHLTSRKE